jgi:adenosine kinase
MTAPILVCGSMALDTIAVFEGQFQDHSLADRIHALSVSFLVPRMRRDFGGCAGNISYGLKLLGGHPIPVATVGEDAGDYLERFKTMGIDTQRVRVVPDTLTAQCFITTDLNGNQITAFHPGAMAESASNDVSGTKAKWAIVAPDSKAGMFAHGAKLHAMGIPFIFDLGQAMPLFDGKEIEHMIALADVLTVNDYEASVVEQRTGRPMAEIAKSLQAVIVTRGANGATLLSQGREQHIDAVAAERVVDPTGCGDAHRAGLLYGITNGWSWADSCKLANVMGSLKIAVTGPQNYAPAREAISKKLHSSFGLVLPD